MESNLDQYDVLILDEIHERNLFGDFLLGVTKCLLHARPQLKVILMSATINVDLFYGYFKDENARLIEIPGRLHPIKTVFMPPPSLDLHRSSTRFQNTNQMDPAPYVQILNLIDKKYSGKFFSNSNFYKFVNITTSRNCSQFKSVETF